MTDISYGELKQHQARLDELLAAVMAANNALTAYIRAAGDDFARIDDYSASVRKALQTLNGYIIYLHDSELDLLVRPRNPFTPSPPGSYRQARGILATISELPAGDGDAVGAECGTVGV